VCSSDEDELFFNARAGDLDDEDDMPSFGSARKDQTTAMPEDEDLMSLQVEIYKNKHLKKRKRESINERTVNDDEGGSASSRKKKKVNTEEYYRRLIEDKKREQEELRRRHQNRMGGTSSEDTAESNALEEKMKEADQALEELMRKAAENAPQDSISGGYGATAHALFSPSNTDVSKELEEARQLLRTSEMQEYMESQKLNRLDQEIERQFLQEKLRREAVENRQRNEQMQQLQALRTKQQQEDALALAAQDPGGNPIKLTVRVSRDESFEVTVGDKATVNQLISLVCHKQHFDPSKCTLEFDGQKLKGHEILSKDLCAEEEDLFDMRVPNSARNFQPVQSSQSGASAQAGKKIKLTFQYGRGASVDMKVYEKWTPVQIIDCLKKKHQSVVEGKQISLFFDGQKIKDSQTLKSLDVEDEDALEMRLK